MTRRPTLPEEALQFFRRTGRAGGLKRAKNLTAKQRSEQARKAVQARWAKAKRKGSEKGAK